jgi:transposase
MEVGQMENNTGVTMTVGIDMGDRWSRYCVLDATGVAIEKGSAMTCRVDFEATFAKRPKMRIAIEAGTHSPWASRVLQACGHEVLVANPRKLRFIYASNKKNDPVDAEMLARVARMDPKLLAPVQHRDSEAQADLAKIRARDALVAARTQLVNHVRGAVKSFGGRLPKCSTEAFPKNAKFIPKQLWPALSPLIDTIGTLTGEIRKCDAELERAADKKYPETKRLREVNGVGLLSSLAFVLTIDDPKRFENSRQVGAYVGLCPRQDQSGSVDRQLGISKTGDEYVRRLLVGCAQYALGPFGKDSDLRRWGLELAQRGGKNAKRRAVVAVARKLAVLLHRLWTTGAEYEPLRRANRQSRLAAAATQT